MTAPVKPPDVKPEELYKLPKRIKNQIILMKMENGKNIISKHLIISYF